MEKVSLTVSIDDEEIVSAEVSLYADAEEEKVMKELPGIVKVLTRSLLGELEGEE